MNYNCGTAMPFGVALFYVAAKSRNNGAVHDVDLICP